MEFFRDTKIDFMGYRKYFVSLSAVLLAVAIFAVFLRGDLNLGIDFAGGTQLAIKFREEPRVDDIRELIEGAGIDDAVIQRFGDLVDNEIVIKTPAVSGHLEGSREQVVSALQAAFNPDLHGFDLNQRGRDALSELLFDLDPDQVEAQDQEVARAHYDEMAEVVSQVRMQEGMVTSWDQFSGLSGVSDEILIALRENARLGNFAILGAENVGPQIGSELRVKGVLAILFSLLGMLAYIWFRFELRFGFGALAAVIHDVLLVLGLFALAGFEFNLTTVAGFLTLIGYSVNDTVVVFDRVRENLRRSRREPLVEVMNRSLNQTLSRTVLTSGTTLLAVGSLLVLGGDVLRGFAFILTTGVVVGTYSSIYVASPFALLWDEVVGKRRAARAAKNR